MRFWMLVCAVLLATAALRATPARAQDSDSLTWARANSCERIRDYIARYPSGRYLAQARAQLTARNCPAPQASAPADPCVQARADWAAIATSSDLGVLRAFRNAAPAACAVQRAQADARIALLEAPTQVTRSASPRQQQVAPQQRPATQVVRYQAGQTFRDCADCPEMVVVPAGSFMMGTPETPEVIALGRDDDEGPRRQVSVRSFAAGRFEVTRGEWAAFVADTGRVVPAVSPRDNTYCAWSDPGFAQDPRHPVVCVNFDDVRDYILWLSARTRSTYRLLSEAEWEYAARGGTDTQYWWGDTDNTSESSRSYANFSFRGGRDQWTNTSPVGSFPANQYGLHDTAGNVAEWVQDCYAPSYAGARTDGLAVETVCSNRVFRGGYWGDVPQTMRPANRSFYVPAYRSNYVGFRVAKSLE